MAIQHTCHVDCKLIPTTWMDREGVEQPGVAHVMHAAEPSSAAGRYQWEQNAKIKRQGRRAWRATGQGQSRECRVWDDKRRRALEWLEQSGKYRIRAFARLRPVGH